MHTPRHLGLGLAAVLLFIDPATAQTPTRRFLAEDMFRVQRVGAVAWSADGRYAAIELTRPGPWLNTVPNTNLSLLDVRQRTLRRLNPTSASYLGFFNALWSPDGRRLAFLSVDERAVVRLWIWTVGTHNPVVVPTLEPRFGPGDPPLAWIDAQRIAVIAWLPDVARQGQLFARIQRGRNSADRWRRAATHPTTSSASVLESAGSTPAPDTDRLIAIDVVSGTRRTLARGRLHRMTITADGCCISVTTRQVGAPVASYFEEADRAGSADAGYMAVNWGTERLTIDARTGARIAARDPAAPRHAAKINVAATPPRSDARHLSTAPSGDAALYLAQGSDGSRLWLSGGAGRPLTSSIEIWRGNMWMSELALGRAEHLAYRTADGSSRHAWLLLPPDHAAGTKVPAVVSVYPTTEYNEAVPGAFSLFQANFKHPQLFASLGYAVLLPSMPAPKNPREAKALSGLLPDVLPAVDAAIASGLVDSERIAVDGHSDGGFAALGTIVQTTRFRSAIVSAGYSNLVSFYGTLPEQSRHGDLIPPRSGQVLRLLQFERGLMGLVGPPWEQTERYQQNSAVLRAGAVQTPVMLIHGEVDSVPIGQAEEFFTALVRQDKRALLVRYAGEGHTISGRANVIDLWQRIDAWLAETLSRGS